MTRNKLTLRAPIYLPNCTYVLAFAQVFCIPQIIIITSYTVYGGAAICSILGCVHGFLSCLSGACRQPVIFTCHPNKCHFSWRMSPTSLSTRLSGYPGKEGDRVPAEKHHEYRSHLERRAARRGAPCPLPAFRPTALANGIQRNLSLLFGFLCL